MSLFITFEGEEGSGKSYQAKRLHKYLAGKGVPVLLTHEPGGTETGEKVSKLVKWAKGTDISPLTELMLFNASRAQLVKEVIRPALESGKVVICDRFDDSTTAYQGYGHELDLKTVREINHAATGGLRPDLTVLLDISVEDGLARKNSKERDRFEEKDPEFHRKVREGYLKLASEEPRRWLVIDAAQPREKIAVIITERVDRLLAAGNPG